MKDENTILVKSKSFALRIIKLFQFLQKEKNEHIMSKQILRSGTSIGANVRESINAQSKMDFIHKLNIALKEADETHYWLELLHESEYLSDAQFDSIISDNNELVGILIKIIKTSKTNLQ